MTGPGPGPAGASGLRWRRVFRGEEPELGQLRLWLAWLLPEHPSRDDVIAVAVELSTNAVRHTASRGSWFAVEVTWHPPAVRVAVADCGGDSEPQVIDDPAAEHGRGLLLVRGLSQRTGIVGDRRGRLIWADIAWSERDTMPPSPAGDPYEATIRDGQAALARRFAGTPAWFGRSTLQWWALPAHTGLVTAPTANQLAALLIRLQSMPPPVRRPVQDTAQAVAAVDQPAQELGTAPTALPPNRSHRPQGQPASTRPDRRDCPRIQPGIRAGRAGLSGVFDRHPVPALR